MNTVIIYAHPQKNSFNRAILNTVTDALDKKNTPYTIIDLYRENFDPVISEREMQKYKEGIFLDGQARRYAEILKKCDKLILIFPIWWGLMPAILKGFFDKVLYESHAYSFDGLLAKGKLGNIRKSLVLSTMNSPRFYYTFFISRPAYHAVTKSVLQFCGIKKTKWLQFSSLSTAPQRRRERYLKSAYRSAFRL